MAIPCVICKAEDSKVVDCYLRQIGSIPVWRRRRECRRCHTRFTTIEVLESAVRKVPESVTIPIKR